MTPTKSAVYFATSKLSGERTVCETVWSQGKLMVLITGCDCMYEVSDFTDWSAPIVDGPGAEERMIRESDVKTAIGQEMAFAMAHNNRPVMEALSRIGKHLEAMR